MTVHKALLFDYINKELSDYLIREHPRFPFFSLLPKAHKPGFPPQGRLIVSTQGPVLEGISKCVDSHLQPHISQTQMLIKDTAHFIKKIESKNIPQNAWILSLDVVTLYISIPHEDIRNTIQECLETNTGHPPTTHFMLDLVDLLLERVSLCAVLLHLVLQIYLWLS